MEEKNKIQTGIYRHFKGGIYELVCIAKNSETLEDMVVYRDFYCDEKIWVRPLMMWSEQVEYNGRIQPRFAFVANDRNSFEEKLM